jgi:aspartate-semialdehyde dehydrogenase
MLARKMAPALAAGCAVVSKPAAETPLSAIALARMAEMAGLPKGLFNLILGTDAPAIGQEFCSNETVRKLSFTGSTEIGKLIAGQCVPSMKRLVMELGGHAPLIVFGDADAEKAADIAIDAKFATSGQDCLAANRIYVQRQMLPAFTKAFAERIARLKVGSGLDGADIGPLMHERAVAKVEEQVADALARGAKLVTGGKRHPAGKLFFEPTLLTDVPDDALIMREETFGPVAAVTVFDTEEEVITRANDTEYGLVAYVVTENGARQMRLSRALEYGMVAINRVKITGGPIPFGGWKQSGLGREGSRHGMEAFTELKYICIDTAA